MSRIALIITGNIASGKSTTCKGLSQKLKGYDYHCVDDIRAELFEKNPDQKPRERDFMANELLLKRCLEGSDNFILENVGTSKTFHRILGVLKMNGIFCYQVLLKCSVEECYDRWVDRGEFSQQIGPSVGSPEKIKEYILENEEQLAIKNVELEVNSEKLNPKEVVKFIYAQFMDDISFLIRKPTI